MKRIGFFGGTFNPVHTGHLIIAQEFINSMKLEQCVFIPAYISPFKVGRKEEQVDISHRLNMLKLAIEDNPLFSIEEYELQKQDISYTFETVKYLRNKYSNDKLFYLIGFDQAENFTKWREYNYICEELTICIANRDNYDYSATKEIKNKLSRVNQSITWLKTSLIEISSSEIRSLVKSGIDIRYKVPDKVLEYIKVYNLYK